MSVSWIYTIQKIEFQYVSDQKKIFIWDKKLDNALPTYNLPEESDELDQKLFIGYCNYLYSQIQKSI